MKRILNYIYLELLRWIPILLIGFGIFILLVWIFNWFDIDNNIGENNWLLPVISLSLNAVSIFMRLSMKSFSFVEAYRVLESDQRELELRSAISNTILLMSIAKSFGFEEKYVAALYKYCRESRDGINAEWLDKKEIGGKEKS